MSTQTKLKCGDLRTDTIVAHDAIYSAHITCLMLRVMDGVGGFQLSFFDRGKCECQEQKSLAMEHLNFLRITNKYCKL